MASERENICLVDNLVLGSTSTAHEGRVGRGRRSSV